MASFLANGHPYRLWTYDNLDVQFGVDLCDAREIVAEEVYRRWFVDNSDQRKHKLPTFACYFRYALINKHGGWWCDADTIALKPFDFTEPYVLCGRYFDKAFMQEKLGLQIINGIFKTPKEGVLLRSLLNAIAVDAVAGIDPGWGEWGPKLFTEHVKRNGLLRYKVDENIFAPFPPGESGIDLQYTRTDIEIPEWAYAIHLWNRFTMDMTSKSGSIHDQLVKRYL